LAEFTGERVVPGEVDADLWNEHLSRYIFAAGFASGKRVVDAGCGTGYGSAELARSAQRVIAFDISAEAIAHARAHFPNPNLSFVQASCAAIPLARDAADVIVAYEVIEHVEAWRDFLAETRRVLSPNGLLIISTPNRDYYAEARRLTGPNPYHVREFDHLEFSAELAAFFPNVQIFLQNHVATIGFQPCRGAREIELAGDGGRRGVPEDSHFLLALCSAATIPGTPARLYVPATANVLRERERHIDMLETEREQLRREKQDLVDLFRAQKTELEASNAWAARLNDELEAARARIGELHRELETTHAGYQARLAELEQSEREKTAWAQRVQAELTECARLLDIAEQTVIERTEWAQRVQADLDRVQQVLAMVKASRWVKIGRRAGLGPELA
jgi:SAM-dependent methyltransferase